MPRRWRTRALTVVLPLATARVVWGRARRVDQRWDAPHGLRTATVLLCAEPPGADGCAPVGWCRLRWYDGGDAAVLERIAWDARRPEADAWAALEALAGGPVRNRHPGVGGQT
jgi:hypothetical protein